MIHSIRNSSTLIMLLFVVLISVVGCKSKKKAMEAAAAAEKARIEQEAAAKKQREEEEAAARARAEEERARREAEERDRAKASSPAARLGEYFQAISSSANTASANASINEALTLFASPETPVLIVISESGGQKDYDRPTTIKNYLNYLKDQKKNINAISDVKFDASGKITELELKKN